MRKTVSWFILILFTVSAGITWLPSARASITTDSLAAYWKFDETAADSCSGGTNDSCDSSGGGNDGAWSGNVAASTSVPTLGFTNARSVDFDGSNDLITVAHSSSVSMTGNFTISLWVYLDTLPSESWLIAKNANGSCDADSNYGIRVNSNGSIDFRAGLSNADCKSASASAGTFTAGAWTNLIGVYDYTGAKKLVLYENGTEVAASAVNSVTVAPGTNSTSVFFGKEEPSGSMLVDGRIDEVRIYSRALSATEISALAAGKHLSAIWTGTVSTDWEAQSNWDINAVPDPFTNVIIRKVSNQPLLTAHNSGASLTLESGAILDMKKKNFELTDAGALKGGGTLKLDGSETLQNPVNSSTGTVLYYGTGSAVYSGLGAGYTYNNLTFNSGLMGYWKFDEGVGTVAKDLSGNGYNGTLTIAPLWSGSTLSPRIQFYNPKSLKFDGDDYVTMGTTGLNFANNTANFSLSAWFKTSAATYQMIMAKGQNSCCTYYPLIALYVLSGKPHFSINSSTRTVVDMTGNTTVNDGAWHHVVAVRKGTTGYIYIDGVEDINAALTDGGSLDASAYPFYVGADKRDDATAAQFFNGNIDDVRVYSRALSRSEVAALYNGNQSTGSGTYSLGSALDVNGNLSIVAGTLNGSNVNVTVAGNYNNVGGFTKGTSTVILDGSGNQTISGSSVFHILSATTSTARTIFFDYTGRQSASGTLILKGISGNNLSLRSTRSGSGARIALDADATESATDFEYLDIKDNDASGGQELTCYSSSEGCTDSGNNTNWLFSGGGGGGGAVEIPVFPVWSYPLLLAIIFFIFHELEKIHP